jgi:hypothetical protein
MGGTEWRGGVAFNALISLLKIHIPPFGIKNKKNIKKVATWEFI